MVIARVRSTGTFPYFYLFFTFFFAFASGDSPTHVFYRERKWNLFRLYIMNFDLFLKSEERRKTLAVPLGTPDMSIHISSAEHQTKTSALILNETGWRECNTGAHAECRRFSFFFFCFREFFIDGYILLLWERLFIHLFCPFMSYI
jgi:hypothetical protein